MKTVLWVSIFGLFTGCNSSDRGNDKGRRGDDDDGTLDASGDWSGICNYISTDYTSVDFTEMDLVLNDNDGEIFGTMTFATYYTGTTSSYSGIYNIEGTRNDDQVLLSVSNSTATFSLVLDGDTMTGMISQYGAPQLDCEFER